jgi:hypothetical protein
MGPALPERPDAVVLAVVSPLHRQPRALGRSHLDVGEGFEQVAIAQVDVPQRAVPGQRSRVVFVAVWTAPGVRHAPNRFLGNRRTRMLLVYVAVSRSRFQDVRCYWHQSQAPIVRNPGNLITPTGRRRYRDQPSAIPQAHFHCQLAA